MLPARFIYILVLIAAVLFCFSNIQAQYKFHSPVSVSHEMTIAQSSAFRNIFEADKETMKKNRVKKISFRNSRGSVAYIYNERGLATQFSILSDEGRGITEEYFYDSNDNIVKFIYTNVLAEGNESLEYFYSYDDKNRLIDCGTAETIFMNAGKLLKINYSNSAFPFSPTSINYYTDKDSPILYSAEVSSDSEGRITSIKDRNGKDDVIITYKPDGIAAAYHVDLITHYKFDSYSRIINTDDDFVNVDYTYKDNSLIDTLTLTAKDDSRKTKYVLEYEFY